MRGAGGVCARGMSLKRARKGLGDCYGGWVGGYMRGDAGCDGWACLLSEQSERGRVSRAELREMAEIIPRVPQHATLLSRS